MIKNTELRIGNWILESGEPSFVYNIDKGGISFYRINDIPVNKETHCTLNGGEKRFDGIPLSPEILEKLGFSHEGKPSVINGQDFYQVYRYGIFTFNSNHGWWLNNWNLPVQPKYLHQLQNLIFSLTGEELEVKGI